MLRILDDLGLSKPLPPDRVPPPSPPLSPPPRHRSVNGTTMQTSAFSKPPLRDLPTCYRFQLPAPKAGDEPAYKKPLHPGMLRILDDLGLSKPLPPDRVPPPSPPLSPPPRHRSVNGTTMQTAPRAPKAGDEPAYKKPLHPGMLRILDDLGLSKPLPPDRVPPPSPPLSPPRHRSVVTEVAAPLVPACASQSNGSDGDRPSQRKQVSRYSYEDVERCACGCDQMTPFANIH
jgi:hypothetical protein